MKPSARTKTSARYLGYFVVFTAIGLTRVTQSIDRLPPDPGYDFFENSYQSGLNVIWKTEGGYVDIPRRVISEIVILFPIRYSAIIGTLLWALMAAVTAITVSWIVRSHTKSHVAGFICGLFVILNPSASESQIGNQSVVKWFLILIVAIVISFKDLEKISTPILATLIIFSGTSNPMTIAAASPLIFEFLIRPSQIRDRRNITLIGAFTIAFLIQFIAWNSTGSGWRKYPTQVYWPWEGSGMFWFYNFLVSPLTFLCIFLLTVPIFRFPKPSKFVINLAIAGLAIWGLPYFLSGMADRYFVVPQILAGVCVVIYAKETFKYKIIFLNALCVFYLLIASIAMTHWYQAMWFLTSGPRWSIEVDHAVYNCLKAKTQTEFIDQFQGGILLACKELLARS